MRVEETSGRHCPLTKQDCSPSDCALGVTVTARNEAGDITTFTCVLVAIGMALGQSTVELSGIEGTIRSLGTRG